MFQKRIQNFCETAMMILVAILASTVYFAAQAQDTVDATTLTGKYMCGYQGWFECPNDGSGGGWFHWFRNQTPVHANLNTDVFPDLSEYTAGELTPTQMHYSDGSVVGLYSSYKPTTELRHFKWMRDYNIDGVWVQRFGAPHRGSNDFTNRVLLNCKLAAETYGRVFTVMYDVSGANNSTLFNDITNDWMYLVDTFKVTASPRYLKHKGKPVVSVWGFGFPDRSITGDVAAKIVKWFKTDALPKYQATFMGGVNDNWRTAASPWDSVCRSVDIISPWFVGRFGGVSGADSWKNNVVSDIAEAKRIGKDYLPVVWPGFSWANMHMSNGTYQTAAPNTQNYIPRLGGTFYWEQAYNYISAGATMLYGAMFDEVDEGTAVLKACPKKSLAPSDGWWLTLDADGYNLPSDWYLRMAFYANKMLNKQIPLSKTMPIDPAHPDTNWVVGVRQGLSAPSAEQKIIVQNNTVFIAHPSGGNVVVTLEKVNGETIKVFEGRGEGASLQIPLSAQRYVRSGVYFLRVKAGSTTTASRVVVLSH